MERKETPRKLTVLLDRDLQARLADERTRLNREHGLPVSMSAAAVALLKAGLAAKR